MAKAAGKAAMPGVTVRLMNEDDIKTLAEMFVQEHWTFVPYHDLMAQYRASPQGCYTAELNGEAVGFTMCQIMSEKQAFGGNSIVRTDLRGQGIGSTLWRERFAFVGDRNLGVNGVVARMEPNRKLGFVITSPWKLVPLDGSIKVSDIDAEPLKPGQTIVPYSGDLAEEVYQYDATIHTVGRRDNFLKLWIDKPGTNCYVAKEDGRVVGYGCIMPMPCGYRLAPLYADSYAIALCLMKKLLESISDPNPFLFITVPDSNDQMMALTKRMKLKEPFDEMYRQFTKNDPDQIPMEKVFVTLGCETALI